MTRCQKRGVEQIGEEGSLTLITRKEILNYANVFGLLLAEIRNGMKLLWCTEVNHMTKSDPLPINTRYITYNNTTSLYLYIVP